MSSDKVKSRYWSAIGWVESLPINWKNELKKSNLRIVISPLHDKDIEEETGEIQKAHYHVLMVWDGPVTLNNAREFSESMGLGSYVERVRSVSNILDYMTHDSYSSKGKYRYNIKDIVWLNCSINDFVKVGYRQVVEYIKANKITQFSKLVDSLFVNMENDILEYVANHTYYVNTYLCSLKNDFDGEIKEAYNLLKGIADECDARGKFTLDKKNYCKLLDVFEQLSIWADEI